MAGVAVVTDSMANLPRELNERLGIEVVSIYYDLGGTGMRRELDLVEDFYDFYEQLAASDGLAATAPASAEDFTEAYTRLLERHDNVISIHVSSGMSDTCANAREAAAKLGAERVVVLDSAGVGGHQGLQALAGARAAVAGEDLSGVIARVRQARQEVKMWGIVESLEYFRRGGRIGTAAVWMGSALDIKPILAIESEIKAFERVRTRQRGIDRLIELMRQRRSLGADCWFVQHAHAHEDAQRLADRLREVLGTPPEFVSELGPASGTHTGPGSLWVGGMTSAVLR
jgi:DegV family protein with EDD domain